MGITPKAQDGDQYSEQEAQRRFEKLVKAALNTRPKPLKSMVGKGRLARQHRQRMVKKTTPK
jgi:tRNA splicing endonuclease